MEYNDKLTKSELLVLKHLANPRNVIAKKINRGYSTISTHIDGIYNKLLTNNAATAIIKALRQGIITLDELEIYED